MKKFIFSNKERLGIKIIKIIKNSISISPKTHLHTNAHQSQKEISRKVHHQWWQIRGKHSLIIAKSFIPQPLLTISISKYIIIYMQIFHHPDTFIYPFCDRPPSISECTQRLMSTIWSYTRSIGLSMRRRRIYWRIWRRGSMIWRRSMVPLKPTIPCMQNTCWSNLNLKRKIARRMKSSISWTRISWMWRRIILKSRSVRDISWVIKSVIDVLSKPCLLGNICLITLNSH